MGKLRSFKCDDDVYIRARDRAGAEGKTLTDVIVAHLRAYGAGEAPVAVEVAVPVTAVLPVAAGAEGVYTEPRVYTAEPPAVVAEAEAYIRGAEAERRGYPCCKHCPRAHSGHSDPCTQGCR